MNAFLAEARKKLQPDRRLLSQYTFLETETRTRRNTRGDVIKETVKVSEVYPSPDSDGAYKRLISVDGAPVSPADLEKRDRKRRKEVLEAAQSRERESAGERDRRLKHEAEERRKEQEEIDEAFRVCEFRMLGREQVHGRPTIAFSFVPRAGIKTRTDLGRIYRAVRGRAWVDEEDYELVRLEIEATRDITAGFGLLARLHKGSNAFFERRKVNDELWLPALAGFKASGRVALVRRLAVEEVSEFSDYKKFTVGTSTVFSIPPSPGRIQP